MTSQVIPFPRHLNATAALALSNRLDDLPIADEYVFDFEGLGHSEPFGMLFVAAAVNEFADRRRAVISGMNIGACGYQAHMGFFRAMGIAHGNRVGEAVGGDNYIPITRLEVANLKDEAARGGQHVGEIVANNASRMAELLTRTDTGDVFDALAYSLQEIMRNVVEHSGARAIEFCLQHWPTKCRVHLAILDRGMGVFSSLQGNPFLKINNDLEALKLGLMPGVSGKMYKGKKRSPYDVWVNSGYGLYMTSRLSSEAGNFSIFSGTSSLTVGAGGVFDGPCQLSGTAIRVSIDTRHIGQLSDRLKKYRDEGHDIAKNLEGADVRGPSVASQMLRARFVGIPERR